MQDYNVVVTDDRHRETVRFWRRQLAGVNGGFRWEVNGAAAAPNGGARLSDELRGELRLLSRTIAAAVDGKRSGVPQ